MDTQTKKKAEEQKTSGQKMTGAEALVRALLEEGVDTAIWLATSADAQHSGGYYRKRELIDW